ncbi:hypothetical protein JI721_15480 [Alicyclobacillus cycloheptanicus]|uniref:Uncharacterized protein n=1 Tax=Alicyclobacillus cycloheptanicus TaxID=1457 RepID=A0ABT9XDI9_9BACL|nr:YqhG family protein [Alicyclobacillus cycloheptanicus]MDQ0188340.1 hypothetical protein [Alicyclobacillus cycloheptanicus]WDM01054.1 hypothetical protein JI721_15480 [Alicyclobacillus cycloheptanicus]
MSTSPLRSADERIAFCDAYFSAVGARCVYQSPAYREYELPRDVDKELTDRPYYWLWVEQTDQEVPPTVLRLAFSEEAVARENERLREKAMKQANFDAMSEVERMFFRPPTAEYVALGSFRLDKIYESIEKRGRFAAVAVMPGGPSEGERPAAQPLARTPWVPWLMVNAVVSYRCDSVQQAWYSVGVCLENGQVVDRFYPSIQRLPLQPVDPAILLRPGDRSVASAIASAKQKMERLASSGPETWAQAASERLRKEEQQLTTYYQSILPDLPPEEHPVVEAELANKLRQLKERMAPRIELDIRQLALVGLVAK